ncbi:MAG TPA: aminotransferase class I/II-fold pyridoxal phosphate-dependent enzyme, partial [bacterium]|nr:aminotransferase class I/II-fold pyridoxal phosphate-dependent enzyme [bacterium]
AFSRQELEAICDMILEENKRRTTEDALYLMYDQVYWMLTFGKTEHFNPVHLRPEIAPYTVMVDAVSKAFAATGVRVGWCVGPPDIIERMSAILGHVGAWAPRAEQMATAELLNNKDEIVKYHSVMKVGVQDRLNALYEGLSAMAKDGLPIKTIVPMGAIYLSVQFNFLGRKKPDGTVFTNSEEIRQYLLFESQIGVVPFKAFGYQHDTGWFRLSVGAVSMKDIEEALPRLRRILEKLV